MNKAKLNMSFLNLEFGLTSIIIYNYKTTADPSQWNDRTVILGPKGSSIIMINKHPEILPRYGNIFQSYQTNVWIMIVLTVILLSFMIVATLNLYKISVPSKITTNYITTNIILFSIYCSLFEPQKKSNWFQKGASGSLQ